ncbi:MAG: single-stranded DNA-binding protein [Proteobacteria bacterium]|nr:single-stranded DNA-binding protein [Pseudomonadota bacterium]
MTQFINKAIIQGNLGADPTVRTDNKGRKFSNFSIATNVEYTNKDGIKRKFTEWHNIMVFDEFLSFLARGNFKKGDLVRVEGALSTKSREDDNGITNYRTQIVVRNSKVHKIEKIIN